MPRISFDPRFIEIEYELWALQHMREVIESQITFLRDQDTLKTFAELRERGWHDDEGERQLAAQELEERQDRVVPRFFRGPYIVSLWACFESGVREVADYLRRLRGAKLSLDDVRGENELARSVKYFEAVLGVPLDVDAGRLKLVDDLRIVRNAIAHANGQRRAMAPAKWKTVCAALAQRNAPQADDWHGVLIFPADFLTSSFDAVNGSLRDLVARARATDSGAG